MNISTNPVRYDPRSAWLHWITAALVILLWALGQTIDAFPRGTARVAARSLHISLGAALALALAYRLWWRFSAGTRLPPSGARWLSILATGTHGALYLLLVSVVLVGLANTWIRGDNLFNLFRIPAFDPGNKDLRETVEELHGLLANILLFVALFHAAAGLLHHFIFKDDVLRRMLPRREPR